MEFDAELEPVLRRFPKLRGVILQVYRDLVHVQKWSAVQLRDHVSLERCMIFGQSREQLTESIVVPCHIDEDLSPSWLAQIALQDIESFYMAILTDDSTIVYYKITRGLQKPRV